jgi:hypothetical protein
MSTPKMRFIYANRTDRHIASVNFVRQLLPHVENKHWATLCQPIRIAVAQLAREKNIKPVRLTGERKGQNKCLNCLLIKFYITFYEVPVDSSVPKHFVSRAPQHCPLLWQDLLVWSKCLTVATAVPFFCWVL